MELIPGVDSSFFIIMPEGGRLLYKYEKYLKSSIML